MEKRVLTTPEFLLHEFFQIFFSRAGGYEIVDAPLPQNVSWIHPCKLIPEAKTRAVFKHMIQWHSLILPSQCASSASHTATELGGWCTILLLSWAAKWNLSLVNESSTFGSLSDETFFSTFYRDFFNFKLRAKSLRTLEPINA